VFDLESGAEGPGYRVTYGDVYHQNEVEQSTYNFEHSNVDLLLLSVRRTRVRSDDACSLPDWRCRVTKW
jgi:glycyl-tRNA synthetase alpha subunit